MIKIIFFDIDNTLISHKDDKISSNCINALKKLRIKGIKIVACTGRNETELKNMGVFNDILFDALILMGGQLVIINKQIIYKNPFERDLIKYVYDLQKLLKYDCIFYTEDTLYSSSIRSSELYYIDNGKFIDFNYNYKEILNKDIYQITIFNNSRIELDDQYYRLIEYSEDTYDVYPFNGGKHKGITELLKYFELSIDESMGIGDSMNDYCMLKTVKYSVAMGNAKDDLKKIATYVTDDVDHDGVVNALEYFDLI